MLPESESLYKDNNGHLAESLEKDSRFIDILKLVKADPKTARTEEEIQKLARGSFQTLYPEDFERYQSDSK